MKNNNVKTQEQETRNVVAKQVETLEVSEYTSSLIHQLRMMDDVYNTMSEILCKEHGDEQGEMMLNECYGEHWHEVLNNLHELLADSVLMNLVESDYNMI